MRQQTRQCSVLLAYVLFFVMVCLGLFNYRSKISLYSINKLSFGEDLTVVSVPIKNIMTGEPIELPQNDEAIIKYIWDNKLIEPPTDAAYQLHNPTKDPSMGQGQLIRKILGNMTNGFFVEAGALDGEMRSNTLFMEQHLGWKGLLVDGDPKNYALMKNKHRKAWISKTCLAIKPHPHQANYLQHFNLGKIVGVEPSEQNMKKRRQVTVVQCIPVFSLLSALNVTTVDYFSLDVEGSELQVLKTIPFENVLIKTLSVEFIHTTEGKDNLLNYMLSKGYKKVGEVRDPDGLANDFIFVHNTVDTTNK